MVALYDFWIWHAFFGCPEILNDLNILNHSPIFKNSIEDRAPKCEYIVNGHKYNINISYLMAFIRDGRPLSKLFPLLKVRRLDYPPNIKKLLEIDLANGSFGLGSSQVKFGSD